MTTTTSEGDSLLRGILEEPHDDGLRLIYADWLEEFGERADLADFIRQWVYYASGRVRSNAALPVLSGDIRQHLGDGFCRVFFDGKTQWRVRTSHDFQHWRGFVNRVQMPQGAFLEHAAAIFSSQPVAEVVLTDVLPSPFSGTLAALSNKIHLRTPPYHRSILASDDLRDVLRVAMGSIYGGRGADPDTLLFFRAISDACVAYGRAAAGLPPMPGAPSTLEEFVERERRYEANRKKLEGRPRL
jgi:uncharacterized protein (TIGR02996 family)